jgi:hypothetical protein
MRDPHCEHVPPALDPDCPLPWRTSEPSISLGRHRRLESLNPDGLGEPVVPSSPNNSHPEAL